MEDKSLKLIKALKSGAVLIKRYEDFEQQEYLLYHFYKDYKPLLELRGWGSGLGNTSDRIVELVTNPELWDVLKDDDYEKVDFAFIKEQMKARLEGKVFKYE